MRNLSDEPQKMRFLIHDHDTKSSTAFDNLFVSEGIEIVLTPFQASNTKVVADDQRERRRQRWVRSIREECLDHLLILNQRHLWGVLTQYTQYYNEARPHQGLGQQAPIPIRLPQERRIHCRDKLGGTAHDYYRLAA